MENGFTNVGIPVDAVNEAHSIQININNSIVVANRPVPSPGYDECCLLPAVCFMCLACLLFGISMLTCTMGGVGIKDDTERIKQTMVGCCPCLRRQPTGAGYICEHIEIANLEIPGNGSPSRVGDIHMQRSPASPGKKLELRSKLLEHESDTPIAMTPITVDDMCDGSEHGFESCISVDTAFGFQGTVEVPLVQNQQSGGFPGDFPSPPVAKALPKLAPSLPKGIGHFKSTECQPKLLSEWNFRSRENDQHLAAGGSLYNFVCAPGSRLPTTVVTMISKFIHLSGLSEDIQRDHPHSVDMFNEKELDAHIFIFNKAQYVFPDPLKPEYFTPEFLSSVEYQRNCQPGKPTIWNGVKDADTFRMTKSIIPFICKITIQLRMSVIDKSHWPSLSEYVNDKLPIHHALLIERTKRDWSYRDSTRLIKSLLLFHTPPDGGILVTSITAIANTALPTVVGKIIDSCGSSGAAEVAETAENTRKYMLSEYKKNRFKN